MTIFHIFTLFPNAFASYFETSILKRAQEKKLIKIKIYNIRDFAKDKHKMTDDRPFGGGAGMVMKAEPIAKAICSAISNFQIPNYKQILKFKLQKNKVKVILLTPSGKQFTQKIAREFSKKYTDIIFICGHYEGVDERLKKIICDLGFGVCDLSVGPYILTGGELAAMVIVDAVSRHIPGVLGKRESLEEEKGSYPVYTRPEILELRGKKYRVPKVLLSGNHKKISEWRHKHSRKI